MRFLAENWVWILFIVAFVAMHLTGHGGCCGAHGGHAGHSQRNKETPDAQQQPQVHAH